MNRIKTKVAVAFGGKSPEHEVSVITGLQVLNNIDNEKYDAFPLYVSKDGEYFLGEVLSDIETYKDLSTVPQKAKKIFFSTDPEHKGFTFIKDNRLSLLNKKEYVDVDVVFPCFHGGLGENGGFQALCEMAGIAYVGSGLAGSINGMDKVIMKDIFKTHNIPMVKYIWFYRNYWDKYREKLDKEIEKNLKYPLFVKPANAGSSIGVNKVKNKAELTNAVEVAMQFDRKIIVEESFENAREINISVMGNTGSELITSVCEEVFSSTGVLSYEEKYVGGGNKSQGMASAKRKVPADLDKEVQAKIEETAKKVFSILDCAGLSRIDFMVNDKTKEIIVLEINTIPGSMAFYLWEATKMPFKQVLTRLIELGFEREKDSKKNVSTFVSNILENFRPGLKTPKIRS